MNTKIINSLKKEGYYLTDGHYRLVSGNHSDTYVQARLALMNSEIRDLFTKASLAWVSEAKPTLLGAFTIGGLILAASISKFTDIKLLVGRKENNTIQWVNSEDIQSDSRLLLIDDVFTTSSQIKLALLSLESTVLDIVCGVLVAIDRNTNISYLNFRDEGFPLYKCVSIPLKIYEPSTCPFCHAGIPPRDLSNPEKNFVSVLVSQSQGLQRSDEYLKGYEKVYKMQKETNLIDEINAWKPWLMVRVAGLPMARIDEDSRIIHFVNYIASAAGELAGC